MKFDVAAVRKCLKSFDFKTLFREHLGWDNHQAQLDIPVDGKTVRLTALAQKRGFVAFVCSSIPDRATRLKIDHQITKSAREHFVIYADQSSGQQVWQWVRREPGKPLASRDHRFCVSQSEDPLIQRLDQIAVSLDEEEKITVVDVAGRARAALYADKVTKKFYDRFKSEHTAFLKLIKGIKTNADLQWYTSLMLNRLMFVYFIQKKGFLDGDTGYLRNRLALVQQAKGKDKFQSFYRYFLLRLFHDGLGKSPAERKLDATMEKLLGEVPYLNGGFFEVHQLEEHNPDIDIPDKAFEKLFDFFDQYSWHLDERPLRADNEINPDVVSYIFEKYINQKQMGAYYTKEDITEYISKNTIIPFLFDAAQKKCAIAFQPDSALWRLLRDDPDRYIYPAVRHGVIRDDGSIVSESELPDFVQTGMRDPRARMHDKRFNLGQAPAGDPIRLVTETWREYMYRRRRCLEVREKLQNGEVHQINDLITLNLDIWQFARDVIVNAEGPELLRAFWHAIEKVTVLDPTCGTGGFLVEAYNHMAKQVKTVEHRKMLQTASILGGEAKPLPYLLAQMNLLLHGLEAPQIDPENSLRFPLNEIGERDRVDVILTNPPFGGEEERGILSNFPEDKQTTETAILFLQLIMRKLRRAPKPGRAAVVVPNGTLSAPGVASRVRAELLKEFRIQAIVRLPHNVFAPYTDIRTNLLFFERGGPTEEILYCEPPLPEGQSLSKTKPLRFEVIEPFLDAVRLGKEGEHCWTVPADDLDETLNLDLKNPQISLGEIASADAALEGLAEKCDQLADDARKVRSRLAALTDALHAAPKRLLGDLTEESDERIGDAYDEDTRLLGVSNVDGFCDPKGRIGKHPERYKIVREGYLAYNPMRVNIGSIGVAVDDADEGITSPDYVVFRCKSGLLPEYVYHYLRSEAGRHEINLKTKGSVRFRLYYKQLAAIPIPVPDDLELQTQFAALCRRLESIRKRSSGIADSAERALDAMRREAFLHDQMKDLQPI